MTAVFDDYARYYDLLYQDKDYDGEVRFIDGLIKKYAPNAKKLLELGCGTGIHAEKLAEVGYSIHGVDLSAEMLKCAKERIQNLPERKAKNLSFSCGDIRQFRHEGGRFDAVISLFHVMSYQTGNSDLMSVCNTVKQNLKPNGVFIFDCWYGPAVLSDPPVVRVKRLEDERIEITRIAEPETYPNDNRVDVHYQVFIKEKSTGKVEILEETHRMRYLFKPEIEQILALCDLSLINSQEWLSGNKLDFSTWNACFVAEKK